MEPTQRTKKSVLKLNKNKTSEEEHMTKLQKNHVDVLVEKNAFTDLGDGVVTFPNGLTITDDTEQKNGTKYDIKSMDVSQYKGQVTADHVDKLENIIARVEGLRKIKNKVVVKKIVYAVNENPLARLAYNLLVSGFSTDFSIETYGPWPDQSDDTYYNARLIGLSQVVVGNNNSATVNNEFQEIVKNSLEQSKEDGLDVSEVEAFLEEESSEEDPAKENPDTEEEKIESEEPELESEEEAEEKVEEESEEESEEEPETPEEAEEKLEEEDSEDEEEPEPVKQENNNKKENKEMSFVTIKNSRDFAVEVVYTNAAGDEVKTTLEAGKTLDVAESQKEALETQINSASQKIDVDAIVANAVASVKEGFDAQIAELKAAFDNSAREPQFQASGNPAKSENEFSGLSWKERHGKQINAAWEYLKLGNIESSVTLNKLNQVNLDELKSAGKVENSLSISDFGNFVISPELLTEIVGVRNDYTALIDATNWQETNSLKFSWLKRSGDIDMKSVELEPGQSGNGNLKPISSYSATPVVSDLEELAAVTPVCNSATRFLAVDILGDVARGYRNDYDRKRAQLVVARLQQAVDAHPEHSVQHDVNPQIEGVTAFSDVWAKVAETTVNGVFIFNLSTYAFLQKAATQVGISGPLSSIFTTGDIPTIFGRPYIIVPNDLMPTLGTADTVTVEVEGEEIEVDHAVFYFDTANFTGRTSGGLQYDLSTDAAYEQGGVVKSAYQRNEMVLRGSFFRGGAILDDARVSGLTAASIS